MRKSARRAVLQILSSVVVAVGVESSVTGLYILELFNVHPISYFHICASEITAIPYNKLISLFFVNVGELWGSAPKFKSLNYGTKTVCLLS